jgi:hypothetical protein
MASSVSGSAVGGRDRRWDSLPDLLGCASRLRANSWGSQVRSDRRAYANRRITALPPLKDGPLLVEIHGVRSDRRLWMRKRWR